MKIKSAKNGYHSTQRTIYGRIPASEFYGFVLGIAIGYIVPAVINLIHNASQKGDKLPVEDLSASFRKAVVNCLTTNLMKAAEDTQSNTIVIAGGVSANSLLRSSLQKLCGEKNIRLYMPPKELCGDNAAMVGSQGYYEFLAGNTAGQNLNAYATKSIEEG